MCSENDLIFASIATRLYAGAKFRKSTRMTGGVSANVHRIELAMIDGSNTRLIVREHGDSHSGISAEREYQLMHVLVGCKVPVPEPLLHDASGDLRVNPFLVMSFVEGSSKIPPAKQHHCIDAMANTLAMIHAVPLSRMPALPVRIDPVHDVGNYLPEGPEWLDLREFLGTLENTEFTGTPSFLHGDFWPENILWQNDEIVAVLDWEDAAAGDPLSDVAGCQLELRYQFGKTVARRFIESYSQHMQIDHKRLALWQIYVAAAAQRFMSEWGIDRTLEAHMRNEAIATIREAESNLVDRL